MAPAPRIARTLLTLASLAALPLTSGCPRTTATPDAGADVDAGPYDPVQGNPYVGSISLDDARVMSLDPATLQGGAAPCRGPLLGRVSRIVDGDTMHVNGVSEIGEWDVRFIGVNAPEISHMGSVPDCYGNEATVFTSQLAGRLVWLTFDSGCNDPYMRTLAYVWVGGGTGDLWQRQLLRRGFARTLSIEPNVSFAGAFEAELSTAQAEGAGLWSACR